MIARIRLAALAGVCLGGLLGGVAPQPSPRAPAAAGEYTILSADFHVHSFPDGLPPWDVAREARRRGLDAIALTSHNSMFSWWLWRHAPSSVTGAGGVIVLPGEELTAARFHMALVGIARPVPWGDSVEAAAAETHAQGGVAILAHPTAEYAAGVDAGAFRSLDGIEAAHPAMETDARTAAELAAAYARAKAAHPGIAAIGSSDFHYVRPIGLCRTYVFARAATAAGLIEAVRGGRTVACDAEGRVHGPPELAGIVEADCDRVARRGVPNGPAARTGTALLWLSLLALVLLGPAAD